MRIFGSLSEAFNGAGQFLINTALKVEAKKWQSVENPQPFIEGLFFSFRAPIPETISELQDNIKPNLPWAEEHFQERISGEPWNPPPSHVNWPFAQKDNEKHTKYTKFSHSYPERLWPKRAGDNTRVWDVEGIRFSYGDLNDVIKLLIDDPLTRQAYVPIFFPEDTGAHHGERIPCTIGYQFIQRKGFLHCIYTIRSCDFLRHFQDDIYMAARLTQWLCWKTGDGWKPGFLKMDIGSLHVWESERKVIKKHLL